MLKRKIFDSIRIVSMNDGALDSLPDDQLNEYQLSRDITLLDLESLAEKPTIFHCKPLMRNYQDSAYNPMPSDLFRLLCAHVTRIENFDGPLEWDTKGEDKKLVPSDENWAQIPTDVVIEVASVIIQTSSKDGDLIPFTPQGTSSVERKVRLRALLAMKTARTAHLKDTANE